MATLDLNHPSWLELTLACAQVGAVHVPINFRLAPAELEYVLSDSGAAILFVGGELADIAVHVQDRVPDLRRLVVIGGEHDEYEAWLSVPPDDERHPAHPDDTVLQLYTSGTTGFPKGAMLTHAGLLGQCRDMTAAAGLTSDDSFLTAMPMFHVAGVGGTLAQLYNGARNVIMRTPEPLAVCRTLERERISHTFLVPALLDMIARHPHATDHDYSALRLLFYGASPIPLPTLRACQEVFPNVFMQVYGMTETSGAVSMLGPTEHGDRANPHRLLSAGIPMMGIRLEIRGPGGDVPLPAGTTGEVCVLTPHLMTGYWNKPGASAAAVDVNGWYRTGDAGHLDDDGYLYITDRIKDLIISGGENIYPAEIERVLAEHPSVAELTVVGVPDEKWGEVPKVVAVTATGQRVDEAELLSYCRERLASYKCPKSVDVVQELPRNASGKILKRDIRARYWRGRERQLS